jgi:hypothetical protein
MNQDIPFNGGRSAAEAGVDSGSSDSVGCDGGSSASSASAGINIGKGTEFKIVLPAGPIVYLTPFSVSIVVNGLGELYPLPEFVVTPNNDVLFPAHLLLAAAIGCSKVEGAAKLRDITKKEQRLYHAGRDMQTISNEVVFSFFDLVECELISDNFAFAGTASYGVQV